MRWILLPILMIIYSSIGAQDTFLDYLPDKSIINQAKLETASQIDEIRDSIGLTRKETRLRNFGLKLDFEKIKEVISSGLSEGEKNKFLKNESIYFYQLDTNPNGSGYVIKFEYNMNGRIKKWDCFFVLVIP